MTARTPAVYVEWNCFASGGSPWPINTQAYNGTVGRFSGDPGTQDNDSDSRAELDITSSRFHGTIKHFNIHHGRANKMACMKRHRTDYCLQATLVRQLPAVAGRHLAKSPVTDLVARGAHFSARRDAKGTAQTAFSRRHLLSRRPKPRMLARQPVATHKIKMWASPRAPRGKRRLLLAAIVT